MAPGESSEEVGRPSQPSLWAEDVVHGGLDLQWPGNMGIAIDEAEFSRPRRGESRRSSIDKGAKMSSREAQELLLRGKCL